MPTARFDEFSILNVVTDEVIRSTGVKMLEDRVYVKFGALTIDMDDLEPGSTLQIPKPGTTQFYEFRVREGKQVTYRESQE